MCCRFYTGEESGKEIRELTGAFPQGYDGPVLIRPTDSAPVVLGTQNVMSPASLRWGFSVEGISRPVINARSETAADKPAFGDSLRRRRCIVPADSFFEYNSRKEAVEFFDPNGDVLFMAGIWQCSGAGSCFTVLTTGANESVRRQHDRMPLLLACRHAADWLFDAGAAVKLLREPMPALRYELPNEQLSLF